MPDREAYWVDFEIPVNWDQMPRHLQARTILHHLQKFAKERLPALKRVVCEYSGTGDSWEGAYWHFYGEGPELDVEINFNQHTHEVLDEFVNQWVSYQHPGWENNEGGCGTVAFDLERCGVQLDHEEYEMKTIHAGTYNLWEDESGEGTDG